MGLVWTENWAVGVPEIDAQHRELLTRTNRLLDAIAGGRGAAEVALMLEFLSEYVVEHFAEEEALLRRAGYVGYETHKLAHDRFVAELRRLKASAGASQFFALEVNGKVCDWLSSHILGADMAWARAIASTHRTERAHG